MGVAVIQHSGDSIFSVDSKCVRALDNVCVRTISETRSNGTCNRLSEKASLSLCWL